MWVLLNDCFFSIVKKDCGENEVLVRARRKGDLHKVWPRVDEIETTNSDYRFRAVIAIDDVAEALGNEVRRITYNNFKNSVRDDNLHSAYSRCWGALASVQPGWGFSPFPADHDDDDGIPYGDDPPVPSAFGSMFNRSLTATKTRKVNGKGKGKR